MAYSKEAVLGAIADCSDPKKLKIWIANARREQVPDIERAAIDRLIEVSAINNHDHTDEPVVLDFWRSIISLEFVLSDENGKTTRLSRTRQKIARVGVKKTLQDLVLLATPSEGYNLLRDRGMLDMSAEAVVLRHPAEFDAQVLAAAKNRAAQNE